MNTRNQSNIKTVLTLVAVAMAIVALVTTSAGAAVIFVVDAPNDGNTTRRAVVPGDGTIWPATVSQTFDLSTGGDSADGLSGTLYVSGTGWFEATKMPQYFNGDYAGDMKGNSDQTAIWTATGYIPGMEVEVYANWTIQNNYATSAPYSINGGAIWVPIAKLDWGWTGIAESTDGGNTWTKTSGAHDTNNPSGSMTTEFPEWPDTATDEYPEWQSD